MQQAILVLGMHRSGTSAITQAISLLGAQLPAQLVGATDHNSGGHFEPSRVVRLHDRVLGSAGISWWSWAKFPEDWYNLCLSTRFQEELQGVLVEEYGTSELFIVKDPRACRLVRFWTVVFKSLGVEPFALVPYRNPVEVAKSLEARDRLTTRHGMLLWLRHVIDAEYGSRSLKRVFFNYRSLVSEPVALLNRIVNSLSASWPARPPEAVGEVARFIKSGLQRQKQMGCGSARADMVEWVECAYRAYQMFDRDPYDPVATALLDRVRDEFDKASDIFAPVCDAPLFVMQPR